MRALRLALIAALGGGLVGAHLAPAESSDCPAPLRHVYADCARGAPDLTMTAEERDDFMRLCVDGPD